MYKITLVNMPFASFNMPSVALTQLKVMVEKECGADVSVRIVYLNQDFASYLGIELYSQVAESLAANMSGLGDWLFRQIAFTGIPDNSTKYFNRFFSMPGNTIAKSKAAILEKQQGFENLLLTLIDSYKLADDDLVGFTSMFSQNVASFALARKLKERKKEMTIVIGGANCETPMGVELAKNIPYIDFVFSGPALKSFPEFVKCQLQKTTDKCHQIRGVISRKTLSLSQVGNANLVGEELDINQEIALDYKSFLDGMEGRRAENENHVRLGFETSRGCWWGERAHCTFCGLNGNTMSYRAMDPQKAIEQFNRLFQYSERCFNFFAVDNILPRSYLKEVLPYLKPPKNVRLFYEVKADLKREELQILADANVLEIQPGIEALATSTLKLMKKGTTAFQNIGFLKNCADLGIEPQWNLLVGFPNEPKSVYEKYIRDIPLLEHLPPPSGAFPVRFDRYSPYFVRAKEYGLDLQANEFYRHVYPFNDRTVENLAYYFVDKNFDAAYIEGVAEYLGTLQALVSAWRQRWFSDLARRPKLTLQEKNGRHTIYDSRANHVAEYEITQTQVQLLRYLSIPRHIQDKAAELTAQFGISVESEIAVLANRRLLFEEDGRYLSLLSTEQVPLLTEFAEPRNSGIDKFPILSNAHR